MGISIGSDLIYKLWLGGKVELLILSQTPRGYDGLKRFRSFQKPVWGLRDLRCMPRRGDGWSMLTNVHQ